MRKLFFIPILLGLFISCNDGDIIVTEFNFELDNLDSCGGPGGYVFFNINNSNAAESISLILKTNDILFLDSGTEEYVLDGNSNIVNYRKYSGDVSSDYFCSNIPPTSPGVTIEYLGESGIAELTTFATKDDEDGKEEDLTSDLNTDGDSLLNYFDDDDDGDNVPTVVELGSDFLEGINENPLDTDNDGIFDYLDDDDDGDGVLTRYEDANGDLDPTNDITDSAVGPNYLNPIVTDSNVIDQYRVHSFKLVSDISLLVKNLILVNGEEQITQETMIFGNKSDVINTTLSLTPDF
ncbi:MAG: hypothetical protein QM499_03225 [Flavobacteriaceae bacterium]